MTIVAAIAPRWTLRTGRQADTAQPSLAGLRTKFEDDNQGNKKVAQQIDQVLSDLVDYLEDIPYTVAVDAVRIRCLWLGLHNRRQGRPLQPSSHLAAAVLSPPGSAPWP